MFSFAMNTPEYTGKEESSIIQSNSGTDAGFSPNDNARHHNHPAKKKTWRLAGNLQAKKTLSVQTSYFKELSTLINSFKKTPTYDLEQNCF